MWPEPNAGHELFGTVGAEVDATSHPDIGIGGIPIDPLADPAAAPVAHRVFRLGGRAKVDEPAAVMDLGQMPQLGEVGVRPQTRKRVLFFPAAAARYRKCKRRDHHQKQSHRPSSSRSQAATSAPRFDPRNLAAVSMQLQRASTKPSGLVTTSSSRVAPDFTK